MRLFKIYESYDEAAFKDFKYHAAELFPKYWDTLYKKFYEDIDYKSVQPRKVERNKMKAQGVAMLKFLAEHMHNRLIAGKDTIPKLNKIAHITEDNRLGDMMTKNFAGVPLRDLEVMMGVSVGKMFRWFRKVDELALEDDDVAYIVIYWFCTAHKF